MADDDQVTLQSQDGQDFKVEVKVAKRSETIKNLIDDSGIDDPIPLPDITGAILTKVLEYTKYHEEIHSEEELVKLDADFCKLDQPTLFSLIMAANYLDMKDLLTLTCQSVANMITGKTPDEIRKTFNVKNDFTPEEEEQVRKENEWCEEA